MEQVDEIWRTKTMSIFPVVRRLIVQRNGNCQKARGRPSKRQLDKKLPIGCQNRGKKSSDLFQVSEDGFILKKNLCFSFDQCTYLIVGCFSIHFLFDKRKFGLFGKTLYSIERASEPHEWFGSGWLSTLKGSLAISLECDKRSILNDE